MFNQSMIRARFNNYRLSFFIKNDLKRLFLKKPGFLKLLTSFRSNDNLLGSSHRSYFDTEIRSTTKGIMQTTPQASLVTLFFKNALQPRRVRRSTLNHPDVVNNISRVEPNIKRVRFKPGYQRMWRRAREAINFTLGIHARYQGGLTRRLVRLRRVKRLNSLRVEELKLVSTLVNMRLVFDVNSSAHLIESNVVYVNGVVVRNKNLPLFLGDFIQILISLRYYITYR